MDDAIMAMTDRHKVFFRPMLQGKIQSNLLFKKKDTEKIIYMYSHLVTLTVSDYSD